MGPARDRVDILKASGPRGHELPAYVSNGLIGLRVRENPLTPGMALLSGFVGEHHIRRIEAAAPAPYPLAADIAVAGVWLSEQPSAVETYEQDYDLNCGELTTRLGGRLAGVAFAIEVLTFASRTQPAIVAQRLRVTLEAACDLQVRAEVSHAGLRGQVVDRRTTTPGEDKPACDGVLLWSSDGDLSRCGVALSSHCSGSPARRVSTWDATGPLGTTYAQRVRAGQTVQLDQLAALVPSVVHSRPHEEAVRQIAKADRASLDNLRRRNRDDWAELWRSRVVVEGASADHQALIDAAFFYLNASVHPASPASTSIFGLATWHDYHYYFGHVMWDIEAFCVPPLILFQPSAARSLLDFRSRTMAAAWRNARLSSLAGLRFPWEAAPLTGEEASPGAGDAAHHEDHVSLHIARAFSIYADVTGDRDFLADTAWPILSGVADWICSRVTWTARGAEILCVTGPAEVPDPPDNDAFTLMLCSDVLKRSIAAAATLSKSGHEMWPRVLEALYLPARSDGVIPSHDGFRVDEDKGATPSPLAGFFPGGYQPTRRQERATLEFFLGRWQDYVGSPMLPALYPVWACRLGDRDLALRLFDEGYAAYDHPRFHQCLEYRPGHGDGAAAGPFFANLGGMLLALVYGLAGLEPDSGEPSAWPRRGVVLPQGWQQLSIERVWIRGVAWTLEAAQGAERAVLRPVK